MTAAKPIDAGTGRLVASFDPWSAAWLSVGAPHAGVGFVELSAVPPFDESGRGDPAATRRHRLELTLSQHAFLVIEVDGHAPLLEPDVRDPRCPRWRAPGIDVLVEAPTDADRITQRWRLRRTADVRIRLRGRLDRPALAEITELDPPPPTGLRTTISLDGPLARIDAGAAVASVRMPSATVPWDVDDGGRAASARLRASEFAIEAGLEPLAGVGEYRDAPAADGGRLVQRAISYVRDCTGLRVGPDERAFLTDHRLLPLSWTRDAYWQALALLACDGPGDRERVADHLRWLWRRCERPDGRWVRSHHANGQRKDLAFQADQQLYPIVELADYWRATGDLPAGVEWGSELERAWAGARSEVDEDIGLIASAENAADDPASAPFIAASQILLWYASLRLAELSGATGAGPSPAALHDAAREARDAFDAQFSASTGGIWPYAVDGVGARVTYHDANDLPIALAPVWGFCGVDDPGWRATMAFAFSPANPAWVEGARAGLGSLHTAGAWTLGDIQHWLWARLVGDGDAADAAWQRLEEVAFADGMLPEAYGLDGDTRVRHWFAWPGAALAALDTLDRSGRLGGLSVR